MEPAGHLSAATAAEPRMTDTRRSRQRAQPVKSVHQQTQPLHRNVRLYRVSQKAERSPLSATDWYINVTGNHYTGGLVAVSRGVITHTQVDGLVAGGDVGGLVGQNDGVIADDGCVSGDGMVGGVVGRSYAPSRTAHSPAVFHTDYVGGLVGNNYGPISARRARCPCCWRPGRKPQRHHYRSFQRKGIGYRLRSSASDHRRTCWRQSRRNNRQLMPRAMCQAGLGRRAGRPSGWESNSAITAS